MRIACDVHTHTLFSRHAYSTVLENAQVAASKHLELLGVTDHFSSMIAPSCDLREFQHFMNTCQWPSAYQGVELLAGSEIDIVDIEGHLFGWDIELTKTIAGSDYRTPQTLKDACLRLCHYCIASVHNRAICDGATQPQATQMYINALHDPKVLILGHIGRSGVDFDVDEVLLEAKRLGKLIEINEHSMTYDFCTDTCRGIAQRCAELDVMISTGTDAHIATEIADFHRVSDMLDEIGFPEHLLATRSAATFKEVMKKALA